MITIQSRNFTVNGFMVPDWDRERFSFVSFDRESGILTLEQRENYKRPINGLPYIGKTGLIEYSK